MRRLGRCRDGRTMLPAGSASGCSRVAPPCGHGAKTTASFTSQDAWLRMFRRFQSRFLSAFATTIIDLNGRLPAICGLDCSAKKDGIAAEERKAVRFSHRDHLILFD